MNLQKEREQKESRRLSILQKPIVPLLIKTSIPTILGMLVMVIYNLTDTFFVGLLHNKSMTAAIGIVFSFVSMIQAIGFWFGYGSGNIMSKNIGEEKEQEAEIISSIGIIFALISGTVLFVTCEIFVVPLSKFLGGDASGQLLHFTIEYLKIIIFSIPFTIYAITLYNQLRLCGNVKDGMKGLLFGMISNMILDPILMFGLDMGFVGAGYATLLGQILCCVILTVLSTKNGNISVNLKNAKYTKKRIYHILVGGMPNFFRQAITSVGLVLLNIVAAKYSESVIAALTISSRITAFAYLIMIGWGQGFQPICAMNYGAKQYDRVRLAFRFTVMIGTVFMTMAALMIYVYAESLVQTMSSDSDVIAIGVKMLHLQCISMPFLSYFAVSSMLLQNIGEYVWAMLISVTRQGIIYIPLLYLLPVMYGQFGIYLLQPVSDCLSFIFALIVLQRYFFKYGLGEKITS